MARTRRSPRTLALSWSPFGECGDPSLKGALPGHMTRRRRPSAASVLAFIALMVALGGTTLAATGQLINIADPTDANKIAKVDSTGKLNVGDGSGPMTVDGTIFRRDLPPTVPLHFSAGINTASSFIKIATAPANKALVIKSITLNTYANPSPGQAQNVQFYIGPTDNGPLAPIVFQINPTGLGLDSASIETGIIVKSGNSLWADGNGSVAGLVFGFGYIVNNATVPAMTYVTPPS
jgi:hypothetical protein